MSGEQLHQLDLGQGSTDTRLQAGRGRQRDGRHHAQASAVQARDRRPGGRPGDGRVDPAEQRARDSDARRILEDELRKEEDALAALQKEYNKGEPERQGNERNYQKYLDRTAELKASIARKESDIESIRRELAKQPAQSAAQ